MNSLHSLRHRSRFRRFPGNGPHPAGDAQVMHRQNGDQFQHIAWRHSCQCVRVIGPELSYRQGNRVINW